MSSLVVVQEINEHTFDKLSDESKEQLVSDLTSFTEEVTTGLKENKSVIHEMFFTSQKELLLRWAESFKKLHYLGAYEKPIDTISDHILGQIGKMTFSENREEDLNKKELLRRNLHKALTDEYKDSTKQHDTRSPKDLGNASALLEQQQYVIDALSIGEVFLRKFTEIHVDLKKKLEDPERFGKLESLIYWDEIGVYNQYLTILFDDGVLDQIMDEQNSKQSATLYQKAMSFILYMAGGYREMAGKLGITPRGGQYLREDLRTWPDKKAKLAIAKIQGSYLCPGGCGYNIATGKKYHDITNDKYFFQFRYKDKLIKIPDVLKNKGLTPFQIGAKLFGRKNKLIIESFDKAELKKLEAKKKKETESKNKK